MFLSGFDDGLGDVAVSFMQSDGGLTPASRFSGYKAILSGPAGGVVGYALTTLEDETETEGDGDEAEINALGNKKRTAKRAPVIGFDMGGTSTDVSRYHGRFEQVTETQTAGVTIQAPQLDITTVAAGGGSALTFKSGTFRVGPESVGSEPGPVCYKKGGTKLSVTDANVMLGRIVPEYFPNIFGTGENEPLDVHATRVAFELETDAINAALAENAARKGEQKPTELSTEDVALGYLRVANETMCRPIRQITESKGHETSNHVLAAFGGAGPQHACSVARALGIKKVFVHRFCGILSAYGMGLADVVEETQLPFVGVLCDGVSGTLNNETLDRALALAQTLKTTVVGDLCEQGFDRNATRSEIFLNLRYDGTDTAMMIAEEISETETETEVSFSFVRAFKQQFEREYGFDLANRDLRIDDVRVRGTGVSGLVRREPIGGCFGHEKDQNKKKNKIAPTPDTTKQVFFDNGWCDTPIFLIETLPSGVVIRGPAVIMNGTATCVIEPGCDATLTRFGDLKIAVDVAGLENRNETKETSQPTPVDPVNLSIFSNRFMGIAEQMGRTLQRTAVSTNIKERLDFSCALFAPDGGLVVRAFPI